MSKKGADHVGELNMSKFREEFLNAHNEYRKNHSAPPLQLNEILSKYAEEWAKTLVAKNKTNHRDQNIYGENLYFASSTDPKFSPSGKEPVDSWYSEIKDFKFGKDPKGTGTGHFTQVVWEDTKEVGVGVAKNKKEQSFVVVANYYPPGNIIGEFASKVHPIGGGAGKSAGAGAKPTERKSSISDVPATSGIRKYWEDYLNPHKICEKLCVYAKRWVNKIFSKNKVKQNESESYREEYKEEIYHVASKDPEFIPFGRDFVVQ